MSANAERLRLKPSSEPLTFEGLVQRIPDAVHIATLEMESSGIATTPEGKFAATYLFATRNILRPVLQDLQAIEPDFLTPIGGQAYNPERTIDEVGNMVSQYLAAQTHDIPALWMRTEESADWHGVNVNGKTIEEGQRFAVIDPLDMTSSIQKKDRVQTSGIAIFDRNGNMKSVGIISLVDTGFVFLENRDGGLAVYPQEPRMDYDPQTHSSPIRVATLTRRMHYIRQLPLFADNHASWTMDCTSGYSVLGLLQDNVDTVLDPFKGNPWYEVAIWVLTAQKLGFPVSDKDGNPIDVSAIIRRMIHKHEGDSFRVPFIISRTPEIHQRVLSLLKPKPNSDDLPA